MYFCVSEILGNFYQVSSRYPDARIPLRARLIRKNECSMGFIMGVPANFISRTFQLRKLHKDRDPNCSDLTLRSRMRTLRLFIEVVTVKRLHKNFKRLETTSRYLERDLVSCPRESQHHRSPLASLSLFLSFPTRNNWKAQRMNRETIRDQTDFRNCERLDGPDRDAESSTRIEYSTSAA